MRKCILMFAFLVMVLLLAVFTDVKKNREFEHELGIGKDLTENTMLGTTSHDSVK
ncbi:hypothetical protein SAMN05421636_101315 [Pricia antarctica]|uniref:Uncharacterized protein n=1 Tax=Pricia antarctica TaxID=641691 RepID=A0A1G6WHF2_9FLAO|nr:hypothetical protein [Pricia antarctica]SDD65214.1 hypothetical protein SAMN05421636_101315 [Pricia antarctica]